jgi:hypothetical protein
LVSVKGDDADFLSTDSLLSSSRDSNALRDLRRQLKVMKRNHSNAEVLRIEIKARDDRIERLQQATEDVEILKSDKQRIEQQQQMWCG